MQITWRNVGTPQLAGELYAGQRAGEQMVKSLDPLKDIITDAQALDAANFKNTTVQNTQGQEAMLRNAASVAQLDQLSNPETLRTQFGATIDHMAVANAAKAQEGLLRTRATDNFLANTPTPDSRADTAALFQGKNPRELDLARGEATLNARVDGVRADNTANQEWLTSQAKIKEDADVKKWSNNFAKGKALGVPSSDLIKAAIDEADGDTDISKLKATLTQLDDADYKLGAAKTEQLDDFTKTKALDRQTIELTGNDNIAKAQAAYKDAEGKGILGSTRELAAKTPGGALGYIGPLVADGLFGNNDIKLIEKQMGALRADVDPKTGIQKHSEGDIQEIAIQAFLNVTDGKDGGFLRGTRVDQKVIDEMVRLGKHLPFQKAASDNIAIAQSNAQKGLLSHDIETDTARRSYRDELHTGKPTLTPTQQIMSNMDNNRPTIDGKQLPIGASSAEFVGAWDKKVSNVLGSKQAFAGTPQDAVAQAMKATYSIESDNGKNVGSKPGTVGPYQIQKDYAAGQGYTLEDAKDPIKAEKMVNDFYTNKAIPALQQAGIAVTPTNLFLMHNQGISGALQILQAASTPVNTRADAAAVQSKTKNPVQPQVVAPPVPQSDAEKHMEDVLRAAGVNTNSTSTAKNSSELTVGNILKSGSEYVLQRMAEDTQVRAQETASAKRSNAANFNKDVATVTDFFSGLSAENQKRSSKSSIQAQLDKLDRQLIAMQISKPDYLKKYAALTK